MKQIIFIVALALFLAGLLFIPHGWIAVSSLILTYVVVSIFYTIRLKKQSKKELVELVGDRVWDLPIELQCQECRTMVDIDFTLDTQRFTCPSCKQSNKVLIQFITVPDA